MAVSFDLFGTLVTVDGPDEPAAAVGRELGARGVSLPADWEQAYGEHHREIEQGRELPLQEHVRAALASRGVSAEPAALQAAVSAAFEPEVETVPGAPAVLAEANEAGQVGLCSNCSVPGLVQRTLDRSDVDAGRFDALVTSVDVGWRKPDRRIFETVAESLSCPLEELVHVGDDPRTDGGIEAYGGRAVIVSEGDLTSARELLEGAMGDGQEALDGALGDGQESTEGST